MLTEEPALEANELLALDVHADYLQGLVVFLAHPHASQLFPLQDALKPPLTVLFGDFLFSLVDFRLGLERVLFSIPICFNFRLWFSF